MASSKTLFIQAVGEAVKPILQKYGGGSFLGWNGQPDLPARNEAVNYPAVFWEIESLNWRNKGDHRGGVLQYTYEGVLNLHVVFNSFGIDPHLDDQVLDIVDEIAAEVFKVNGDDFGRIFRTDEIQDTQHEQTLDFIEVFRFGLSDSKTFVNDTQEVNEAALEATINFTTNE